MERWICTECLEETDELVTKTFHSDTYGDETVTYCQACHSENSMEPMERCPECGYGWRSKRDYVCVKCQLRAKDELRRFARRFTREMLWEMQDLLDGHALDEFQ